MTQRRKGEKLDNLLEIISHFEAAKLFQVDVDSDGYMYIELETYNNMKNN